MRMLCPKGDFCMPSSFMVGITSPSEVVVSTRAMNIPLLRYKAKRNDRPRVAPKRSNWKESWLRLCFSNIPKSISMPA